MSKSSPSQSKASQSCTCVQDFSRTAVSLVQIVLLLVPLASLVFGGLALTPDSGAAELLYSQPVPRGAILIGRNARRLARACGGGTDRVRDRRPGGADAGGPRWPRRYGALVVTAIVITGVFLAIATLLASLNAGRRTRVLAAALVVWFITVVLFDVAVLGIASMLRSGSSSRLLISATLINPVDAARTGALLAIEGTAAFGAASLALLRFTGGAGMTATLVALSLAAWFVAPLWLAARALSRTDI